MEPLFDLDARVLAIGTGVSTNAVVDGLLRLHAAKKFSRPITFYIVGGADGAAPLTAVDAMLVGSVMRTVRSPIRTVGLGWLRNWQPLLLASGTLGQRYLLPQTLVALGPLDWNSLPLPRTPIGLHHSPPEMTQPQTERMLQSQLDGFLSELKLPPELFSRNRLLTAQEAVENRLADHLVERISTPELSPTLTPISHEPQT
jgi:hypothetical protein